MSDFRIYNLALGRLNNFFARTDNVFAQSDATPDVTSGVLFFSNNTSNTTITNFDLTSVSQSGNNAGQFEGKQIGVFFLDGSTRLVNGGRLVLASSNGLQGEGNYLELLYHNSSWYETTRSYNQSNVITVDSNALKTVSNTFPNASTGNVIIAGRGNFPVIKMLHSTGSNFALRRLIGGEEGQHVTIIAAGASDSLVIVNSDATDTFICMSSGSATQFRLTSSAAVTFVYNNRRWHEITPVVSGTGGISTAL